MKRSIKCGSVIIAALLSVAPITTNAISGQNNIVQAASSSKKLVHSAVIYTLNKSGKLVSKKKTLRKSTHVKVLGYKKIGGKKYARIGKNQYIEVSTLRTASNKNYRVNRDSYVYDNNSKRVKGSVIKKNSKIHVIKIKGNYAQIGKNRFIKIKNISKIVQSGKRDSSTEDKSNMPATPAVNGSQTSGNEQSASGNTQTESSDNGQFSSSSSTNLNNGSQGSQTGNDSSQNTSNSQTSDSSSQGNSGSQSGSSSSRTGDDSSKENSGTKGDDSSKGNSETKGDDSSKGSSSSKGDSSSTGTDGKGASGTKDSNDNEKPDGCPYTWKQLKDDDISWPFTAEMFLPSKDEGVWSEATAEQKAEMTKAAEDLAKHAYFLGEYDPEDEDDLTLSDDIVANIVYKANGLYLNKDRGNGSLLDDSVSYKNIPAGTKSTLGDVCVTMEFDPFTRKPEVVINFDSTYEVERYIPYKNITFVDKSSDFKGIDLDDEEGDMIDAPINGDLNNN